MGTTAQLAAVVLTAGELGGTLLLDDHRLLSHCCSPSLLGKGGAELAEQFAALLVGLSGGDDDDIHAADLVDLVELDLGEDDLLLQAQGVVAAAVEGIGGDAGSHARGAGQC